MVLSDKLEKDLEEYQRHPFLDESDDDGLRDFYTSYFINKGELNKFLQSAATLDKKRLMVWQTKWLTEIADGQELVRENRPALKVHFLIILAESIAKMVAGFNFNTESESKKYVQKFFTDAESSDREKLLDEIQYLDPYRNTSIEDVANFFYKIRCDLAHEGLFWTFHFNDNDKGDGGRVNTTSTSSAKHGFVVRLSYRKFKEFIVRTAIKHIRESGESEKMI